MNNSILIYLIIVVPVMFIINFIIFFNLIRALEEYVKAIDKINLDYVNTRFKFQTDHINAVKAQLNIEIDQIKKDLQEIKNGK